MRLTPSVVGCHFCHTSEAKRGALLSGSSDAAGGGHRAICHPTVEGICELHYTVKALAATQGVNILAAKDV